MYDFYITTITWFDRFRIPFKKVVSQNVHEKSRDKKCYVRCFLYSRKNVEFALRI